MRRMRRLFLASLIVAAAASAPSAQDAQSRSTAAAAASSAGIITPPLSPRNASYTITARLDPQTRTITGSETITWRNIAGRPVSDLQFHLYWNAWKNTRSTFMRERALGGGDSGDRDRHPDEWANIEVTTIAVGGRDRTASKRFIAPDDENANDETVMSVPLVEPVESGGSVDVQLAWTAHVPRTFARTGAIGNFFFIAQWFPKLGVLQESGWNCHQFHSGTEFFSDYGVYDVSLTVPATWPIGATGVEGERRDNADGTATHRFHQDDVHDFAWTTSPDYVVRTARFDDPRLPAVDMRLLLQPEHASQAERHFEATRTTLKYYGDWYGPYPYGHITIIDPAFQSGAGGMEYPTLFTAGTRWLAPPHVTTPEGVTVHEAGHQFWYGMVGNNEFEDAWMDEGFNTFSTARAIAQVYEPNFLALRYFGGFVPWVFKDVALSRETEGNRLAGYRRDAKSDIPSTATYRYFPATGGSITYNKTALWLNTLERMIGWPTLQRILSAYFEAWKFKHPAPDDFFAVANSVGAQNLGWFFDQAYRSSNVSDYAVQTVKSQPTGEQHRTTVVVRRHGEAIFPVDLLVTFADGEQVTEHWDGQDRWKAYIYERRAPAISAEVDPGHVLLLDVNYTNNSQTLAPASRPASAKWSMTWMVWLQDCLMS